MLLLTLLIVKLESFEKCTKISICYETFKRNQQTKVNMIRQLMQVIRTFKTGSEKNDAR